MKFNWDYTDADIEYNFLSIVEELKKLNKHDEENLEINKELLALNKGIYELQTKQVESEKLHTKINQAFMYCQFGLITREQLIIVLEALGAFEFINDILKEKGEEND